MPFFIFDNGLKTHIILGKYLMFSEPKKITVSRGNDVHNHNGPAKQRRIFDIRNITKMEASNN